MIRSYNCLGDTCTQSVPSATCIITNKKGAYFGQTFPKNISQHEGLFNIEFLNKEQTNWIPYKIIDEIIFTQPPKQMSFDNGLIKLEKANFCLTQDNTLLIDTNEEYSIDVDCRQIYDTRTQGRIYKIQETTTKGYPTLIITYKKFTNDTLEQQENEKYICIIGMTQTTLIKKWIEKEYTYDTKRKHQETKLYVYRACKLRGSIALTCANTQQKAIQTCYNDYIHKTYHFEINEQKNKAFLNHIPRLQHTKLTTKSNTALSAAMLTLKSLVTKINTHRGIWAGLPWFYHYWTRDELTALGAIIKSDELHFAIDLIKKYLEKIDDKGLLPNRIPHAQLSSADGIGLFCLRFEQILQILRTKGTTKHYFTKQQLEQIKNTIKQAIHRYETFHTENELVNNKSKETWMDTDTNNNGFRGGKRIELQALHLCMHKLLKELCLITLDDEYKIHEKKIELIKQKVQEVFVRNYICVDGIDENHNIDNTIRPNVFLAYYYAPELLPKKIWKNTFDQALEKLWLKWGGLSSIQQDHSEFKNEYSGENNASYHRGDSWYFINNIAAMCLHDIDKHKYKKYIQAIVNASTDELLWHGTMGGQSEISSAIQKRSEGCWLQAWSCSTYIELMLSIS